MSIVFQNFQLFPDACFLRNAFFSVNLLNILFSQLAQVFFLLVSLLFLLIPLERPTILPIFPPCVGLSPSSFSFIPSHPSQKTYYPANFPSLRRSFPSHFFYYLLLSLEKDLLSCQSHPLAQVFLCQYSLLPLLILLNKPTNLHNYHNCVGISQILSHAYDYPHPALLTSCFICITIYNTNKT